jgi:hypothetical protein
MEFWIYNPKILLQNEYIGQLYPTSSMEYNEKLNAISRCIILITMLCFLFTRSVGILLCGMFALIIIILIEYRSHKDVVESKEGFNLINPLILNPLLRKEFEPATKTNPLGNVLLTSIGDDPKRKSALPAFNPIVVGKVDAATKKCVQNLNPGIKNTDKQLFGDLSDEYEFERSMWNFYSVANTKIPNDQGAFASFLYGSMPSCRGGDVLACEKDNVRYNLY